MFYKNIIFVWPIWWFGLSSNFSGTDLYSGLLSNGYNILFSGFPIIWYAIQDKAFAKDTLLTNPNLYSIGPSNTGFKYKDLARSLIKALMQQSALMSMALYSHNMSNNTDGIYIEG